MLIGLGSNVASSFGPPPETLRAAARALVESGFRILASSQIYATPAYPAGIGPDFANAVVVLDVGQSEPEEVLARLQAVEEAFGRERGERWGPRTLDLDLLAHGKAVLPDQDTWAGWRDLNPAAQRQTTPEQLILPHPRMADRLFVLVPLAEVAPRWRHPVTGAVPAAMIAARPAAERRGIRAIGAL